MHPSYRQRKYERLVFAKASRHVLQCEFARPKKLNAWDPLMWDEVREFFKAVAQDADVRVVVVSAGGRAFTAGLDLKGGGLTMFASSKTDPARQAIEIRHIGKAWQQSLTNIAECGKAVIVCMHGPCIGVGVEMASACDIRMCTKDTYFAMPEVSIGLAADVGGLQRFPKVVGNDSLVRELALSGRIFDAQEAKAMGFVSHLHVSKGAMLDKAMELATLIAAKTPVATYGVKTLLNYSRDHTVSESLEYGITWNQAMLQTSDMQKAAMGHMMKKIPEFDNIPPTRAKL